MVGQALQTRLTVAEFSAYPAPVMLLCKAIGRSPTTERVQNNISRVGGQQDGTLGDLGIKLVDSEGAGLRGRMPNR